MQIVLIDYEDRFYTEHKENGKLFIAIGNNNIKVVDVLNLIQEIQNSRIEMMKECNARNIEEYNKRSIE